MNSTQNDHLKAYGIVYNHLKEYGGKVAWLLNYKGGSFVIPSNTSEIALAAAGVSYTKITEEQLEAIMATVSSENMERVWLEKAPKIAVFTPLVENSHNNMDTEPWDDAVILVLDYAGIPYDKIYIDEVLEGKLADYEWVHLHHEDFTGQFGKFYASFKTAAWYISHKNWLSDKAKQYRMASVSQLMRSVSVKIAEYTSKGGFLFAMCSATDSIDVALAALNTDIVPSEFDGTPVAADHLAKLDYSLTFAFSGFIPELSPDVYEFSDIDVSPYGARPESGTEDFILFDFSAKQDPIPTMLCQSHEKLIHGFMGQTSTFTMKRIKKTTVIMGFLKDMQRAKYIYGGYGKGFFTFYGGHDPEDFAHRIGDPPTDVSIYKNSSGYRLILNNVLFPAMRKKKQKT